MNTSANPKKRTATPTQPRTSVNVPVFVSARGLAAAVGAGVAAIGVDVGLAADVGLAVAT
jgi:hypothetical protein